MKQKPATKSITFLMCHCAVGAPNSKLKDDRTTCHSSQLAVIADKLDLQSPKKNTLEIEKSNFYCVLNKLVYVINLHNSNTS